MVAECLVLFYNYCDLALLIKSSDAFIVDQSDDWGLYFFVLVSVGGVVVDTLLAVAKS